MYVYPAKIRVWNELSEQLLGRIIEVLERHLGAEMVKAQLKHYLLSDGTTTMKACFWLGDRELTLPALDLIFAVYKEAQRNDLFVRCCLPENDYETLWQTALEPDTCGATSLSLVKRESFGDSKL